AGLGGNTPLGRTHRFGMWVGRATSAKGRPSTRALVSPPSLARPKSRCRAGRRRSESTRHTRDPAWAQTAPKLATEVVLPSPAVPEVTTMFRHGWSRPANWMLVLRVR